MKNADTVLVLCAAAAIASAGMALAFPFFGPDAGRVRAGQKPLAAVTIDYPSNGSVFPPDIAPPTILWRDGAEKADRWKIEVHFADGGPALQFDTAGERLQVGKIDPRCISENNEPPRLTDEQAEGHSWTPGEADWAAIKRRSVSGPARMMIEGQSPSEPGTQLSRGEVTIQTSKDPVGAPIFYRDVPLMPSATEKGVIKPLAQIAIPLIQWRLKSVGEAGSRVVLEGMHTCANCHSFSGDGKTLGIDMDGPQNDKGLYAVVSLKPETVVRSQDMVNWNPTEDKQFAFNRVGFMSQVSPDGKRVLTMLTSTERGPENNYYVANFKDYRFLQVFYPTRGILVWYDRSTGQRHPLTGADDPEYVQTNGVWSPDGKWIVFARARARNPYPADGRMATHANDPNEIPIQYDLYRVPFNEGRGGKAEPIEGASGNGMSNSFPKVSPDGKWIVFVEAKNGEVMRPDSQLYIVPAEGGKARRMNANMTPMNSWHSWSPNGRWLVFSSKSRGPYTKMYLTHIDESGKDSPAILIENATAANRAVNLPEFVNIPADGLKKISTPAVEMYGQFDHAVELADKGDDAGALEAWQALKDANPEDARIRNNLGSALTRAGQAQAAIAEFESALELNPQYNLVHANLASALALAGKGDEALREYQKSLEAYPESADLHNRFGVELRELGHVDLARGEFARAVELDPKLAGAHNNLGLALLGDGHASAGPAEAEFKAALALDPGNAQAANNLGTLYGMEGRDKAAEEEFRAALALDPKLTKAMVNLGATLASESRFAEAESELNRALALEPENKDALQLKAMIKANGGH